MRLGLYNEPVHTDGRTFDTYGPNARYALEFARHFDQVTVFAPTTDQPTYFSGVALDAPNLAVAPLPFFMTHAQAYARLRQITRVFRAHADSLDVVIARNTAPLAWVLWRLTRKRGVPFFYHFASDPFEVIARSPRYGTLYRLFARTGYGVEFALQKRIMRAGFSFANGRAVAERLRRVTPNVEAVISSSLLESDYHEREDSCTGSPVRLLFVGGLRPGKGLDRLVAAVGLLTKSGRNVELNVVGDGELRGTLEAQARGLGIAGRVRFSGHAVMGPDLNAHYNAADLFILPSLSEASPRAVLEALGHSLPVIATDVGNVADLLDGGRRGVLLPEPTPEALAAAIERLIDDGDFRRRSIREGYRFARDHSMEAYIAGMARKIHEVVRERQGRPAT
jgi:glycosyltransferase involved in cell wall biosynthesis